MNSQWNPSLYEVWRQKIAEDVEKQVVRRVCWDSKVPGICARTKVAVPLAWHVPQDTWRKVRSPAPSPSRAGRAARAPEGTWILEVPGGNRDKVGDTQRQYTFAGTVDAGIREVGVLGNTWKREELRHVRPLLA